MAGVADSISPMIFPGTQELGWAYLFSELLLTVTHRARGRGTQQDRSTLRMLWLVILSSVAAGIYAAMLFQWAALPQAQICRWIGLVLFTLGLALRWWAIITLGRFFTVAVQIQRDHELVERGPFRVVRHPSYTGVLLAFAGFAISLANWVSLVVILLPIFLAFIYRMNVEEQALSDALGERYLGYMRRTKRLLPGIY